MVKLVKLRVLLIGLNSQPFVSLMLCSGVRGLGIEIAKNITLSGINTLTLYDPTPTKVVKTPAGVCSHQLRLQILGPISS